MIVVADTTPLNYLILLDQIDVLPLLYRGVLIPSAVHCELQHVRTPGSVREWAQALPTWCEVREVQASDDAGLNELDAGERDAIQLALNTGGGTVLMDESEGRREAERLSLHVTGTLAVLEIAAQRGLLDLKIALQRLEKTSFRLSPKVRDEFMKRNL